MDVDFDRAIDATTFTSADVTITGPVGSSAITVNSVVSLDADSFRITFSPLTTRGTYTAAIGPNISDTLGRRMDQDKDGTAGEATDDQFRKSLAYINANVIFSAATTISETNTAFDGKDLLIDGATVAIDGPHSFNSVHVVNGGKLTHTALTTTTTHKLSLTVSQQVIIDASSSIDVTGK
ncbi:MAG: hypothetical protein NT069_02860 [Planctomycetota bacterium]|nr:hypothetical protein [Planctomycetota bacterium]